jgi:hypothetical protein
MTHRHIKNYTYTDIDALTQKTHRHIYNYTQTQI